MTGNNRFLPRGEVAEASLIFSRLAEMGYGDVLPFADLDEMLERDFRDDRSPIYRATRKLESEHKRSVVAVEGVGYRVAYPDETVGLVSGRLRRSVRQVRRGRHTSKNAPVDDMSPEARQRLTDIEMRMARVEAAQRLGGQRASSEAEGRALLAAAMGRSGVAEVST